MSAQGTSAAPADGSAGDRQLCLRCADGDGQAWRELVHRFDQRILTVLLRAAGAAHSGELPDLRQEVWARLLARRGAALRRLRAERPGALEAFVGRVALRVAIDFGRARGQRAAREVDAGEAEDLAAPGEGPDEAAQRRQRAVRLERALLGAAEGPNAARDLTVLRAHFREGLNPAEIAGLDVGLSPKGVETLLRRAGERIAEALAPLALAAPPGTPKGP